MVAIVAATVGGALASFLRQPVVVGYLFAGILIGPYTPGPATDPEQVRALAELGVALLMFALGVQFSLRSILAVRQVALYGGGAQIALTIGLGIALGPLLGTEVLAAAFFGALMALSSTAVALRALMERGQMESVPGRVVLGINIVQDLSLVPLIVLFPALAAGQGSLTASLGLAVLKGAGLLVATYLLGVYLVPRGLGWVAATRSRELFLLAVLTLAMGIALAANSLGLSLALGAFLAGLIVSESEFSHQALAEVLPLRDIFAAIFFVSLGMLIDPAFLMDRWALVALVATAIVVGKALITAGAVRACGYGGSTAVYAGLALAQVGEFSFVLARTGLDAGIIDQELNSLLLACALVSIVLTPWLLGAGPWIAGRLAQAPGVGRLFLGETVPVLGPSAGKLSRHVVICGFGRVGSELAEALEGRGAKYLVIESDPFVVRRCQRQGVPCIYGQAASGAVLAQAGLERARVLAVALPDPVEAEAVIRLARRLNPGLDIIARAHGDEERLKLLAAGAAEVVEPEFEGGLEFVRHTLHRFGVSGAEIMALIGGRRARRQGR